MSKVLSLQMAELAKKDLPERVTELERKVELIIALYAAEPALRVDIVKAMETIHPEGSGEEEGAQATPDATGQGVQGG